MNIINFSCIIQREREKLSEVNTIKIIRKKLNGFFFFCEERILENLIIFQQNIN